MIELADDFYVRCPLGQIVARAYGNGPYRFVPLEKCKSCEGFEMIGDNARISRVYCRRFRTSQGSYTLHNIIPASKLRVVKQHPQKISSEVVQRNREQQDLERAIAEQCQQENFRNLGGSRALGEIRRVMNDAARENFPNSTGRQYW